MPQDTEQCRLDPWWDAQHGLDAMRLEKVATCGLSKAFFKHQQLHLLEGVGAIGANQRLILKGVLEGTIKWSKDLAGMSFGKSYIVRPEKI